MKKQLPLENLKETVALFSDALRWLRRSYGICQVIDVKASCAEEEYDALETLTSRYARVTDMMINKVFRSIDTVEFLSGGTLLDVVNRADKRGIITSVDHLRELKDLRNQIAHEYAGEELLAIFQDVLIQAPSLLSIAETVLAYCDKLLKE